MSTLYLGAIATHLGLPLSAASQRFRRWSRKLRGKVGPFLQNTRLPQVSWKDCTQQRLVRIWEHEKNNGNVRIGELYVLSALAAGCAERSNLFEIGTFDGRTTLNLALHSPESCHVYTLDLPPERETVFSLAPGERHMVEKARPGTRYEKYRAIYPAAISRIHQLLDDSAAFDFAPYRDSCSLVFVDGSHDYDYVVSDTRAAMAMARPGGVVVWHDYGVWPDVTRALEELAEREGYGLAHIRGTSLAYWKKR